MDTHTTTTHLRVYIVANNPLARVGLASVLGDYATIVGQSANDDQLLSNLDIFRPDLILWDLGWDNVSETEHLLEIIELNWLLLVMLNDESQASALWRLGVRGLLFQETNPDKISIALAALQQGLVVFDKDLAPILEAQQNLEELPEHLTQRELEVLHLIAEGLSNKAIAYQLGISDHTVKFHVTAIMTKLSAQSRTEAVVRATRLGLIHL